MQYSHNFLRIYATVAIATLTLTPDLPTPVGLPSIRLDDFLLIGAPVIVALSLQRIVIDIRVLLLFLIAGIIIWAALLGAINNFPARFGDLFVLFRIAKYIGAVVLASALLYSQRFRGEALLWTIKVAAICGIILVGVVLQQYFNLFGLNDLYVRFVAPTQYETLIDGYPWPRPVGMVGNPNELGFLLGLLSLWSIWLFLYSERKKRRWLVLFILFMLGAFLTLSRSAVFSITSSLLILFSFPLINLLAGKIKKNLLKNIGTVIMIGLASLGLLILTTPFVEKVLWRFSPEYFGGWYQRVENWSENFNYWLEYPIFGIGPLRHSNIFEHAADNEWLLLLRTGGMLLTLLVFVLFMVGVFNKNLYKAKDGSALGFAMIAGIFIYMIPAAFFYSTVLMPLGLIMLTLALPSVVGTITLSQKTSPAI